MEYLTQWEFWQEVGLTAAARLSVVAVALWAVKVALDHLRERTPAVQTPQGTAAPVAREVPPLIRVLREGGVRESRPLDERGHTLTLKKSDRGTTEQPVSWRAKMETYLSGEPLRTTSASGQQRRGDQ